MAKLKAPLLSLGASGKIADALVFFPWKGLDCVREYVVPANPNTTDQQTQRGFLRDAVAFIHTIQAISPDPLDADDIIAYALFGSTFPTPRTWFNTLVKQYIDQYVATLKAMIGTNGGCTPGADQLSVTLTLYRSGANPVTAGNFWYGLSKTALNTSITAAVVAHVATATIPNLTTGLKYYVQFRPTLHADYIGVRSGIYHGTPT